MSCQAATLLNTRPAAWPVRDLVLLGIFAAAAKVSTLLVALLGGGMNPVTLLAKNCIFTILLLVLLFKLRKKGALLLFIAVNMLISLFLLGGTISLLVPMLLGALLAEGAMLLAGGQKHKWTPFLGAAVYDFTSKVMSLGMSLLLMRESPALVYIAVPIIGLGYLGSLAGLWFGGRAVKELRCAGFVSE